MTEGVCLCVSISIQAEAAGADDVELPCYVTNDIQQRDSSHRAIEERDLLELRRKDDARAYLSASLRARECVCLRVCVC